MENETNVTGLELVSPVFRNGATIPLQYTCKGQNVNPPLIIMRTPSGTKSLALIMHDPDAVNQDFVHWLVWDISPKTETIGANSVPTSAVQGPNGDSKNSYTGPCPPSGTGMHHYKFELYALDTSLRLDSSSNREKLQDAMRGHILQQHILTGLVASD